MMNKKIAIAGLSLALGVSTLAAASAPSEKSGFLANPNFTVKKEHSFSKNLKAVNMDVRVRQKNGEIGYNNTDVFVANIDGKEYVISGKVYDEKGQVLKMPIDKAAVDKGVVWSVGTGETELYLVTNPSCPWCAKFEKKAHESDFFKKFKVNVIILPFHANAIEKTKWVLAGETEADKAQRFKDVMINNNMQWQTFKPDTALDVTLNKLIAESEAAAKSLGATGTPSLFDASFNKVDNWPQLMNPEVKVLPKN